VSNPEPQTVSLASKGKETAQRESWRMKFRKVNLRSYTMLFALAIIAIFFQISTDGTVLNPRNFSILFRQMSITGILTIGMLLLIVSGNFDLSVGSAAALTGGIAAVMQVWYGVSTPVAILLAVLVGVLIGVWQGFWVAYQKVPSFIVTLGGLIMFRGIYLVITDGVTITPLHKNFTVLAQGFVPPALGMILAVISAALFTVAVIRGRASKKKYGIKTDTLTVMIVKIVLGWGLILGVVWWMNRYLGIPMPVIIMLVLALIFTFIAIKTEFGRKLYAIGGNLEAARFSGISIETSIMRMFILMGVLSAITGVLLTARLDGATASAGTNFELDAIAACVIGGASLTGGVGSIFFALVGALVMASLDNGMSLMNTSSYFQFIVKGLVLIVAVWFDVWTSRRSK
jgi:D-xylose transport system permease protein